MKIDYTAAGTNRRWRFHGNTLERVWEIGYIEGTGNVRCMIPPTNDGSYKSVPMNDIVRDSEVLMGLSHHSPTIRARFAALPEGVLVSAQEQVRTDDPGLAELIAGRLARMASESARS